MNISVNFELSKLLKEKRFDTIDCNGYYHICNGYAKGYAHCYSDVNTQKEDAILAPTVAEAVMWLYEKHKIWIAVSHEMNDLHQTEWFWVDIKNGEEIAGQYLGFSTPTEAYEAAIEYTLNNLI